MGEMAQNNGTRSFGDVFDLALFLRFDISVELVQSFLLGDNCFILEPGSSDIGSWDFFH